PAFSREGKRQSRTNPDARASPVRVMPCVNFLHTALQPFNPPPANGKMKPQPGSIAAGALGPRRAGLAHRREIDVARWMELERHGSTRQRSAAPTPWGQGGMSSDCGRIFHFDAPFPTDSRWLGGVRPGPLFRL